MIYPWWQTGFYFYTGASIATGQRFYFRKKQRSVNAYYVGGGQPYINTQPWPVHVDEIRFFQLSNSAASYYDTFSAFGVKLSTTKDGDMINDFVPISCLYYTDVMRIIPDGGSTQRGGKMSLPYPMYIDSSESLSFRIFPGSGGVGSIAGIQIGALGWDPHNEAPVVRTAAPVTVTAGQAPTDFTLESGRDRDVRAIELEALSFSISGGAAELAAFWEVELEINPPRGPKWTDDVSTHLGFIVDQLPTLAYAKGAVTLTLESPIILDPGGRLFIEGMTLPPVSQISSANISGWIACMVFGHQEVPNDYHR